MREHPANVFGYIAAWWIVGDIATELTRVARTRGLVAMVAGFVVLAMGVADWQLF